MYLAGTVMLIFGMGLYGLFISNVPPNAPPITDRALKGSSLFGMFALKVLLRFILFSLTTPLIFYRNCSIRHVTVTSYDAFYEQKYGDNSYSQEF